MSDTDADTQGTPVPTQQQPERSTHTRRPRKVPRSRARLLQKLLFARVQVRQGEKLLTLTRLEAILQAMIHQALTGQPTAQRNLQYWTERCGLIDVLPPEPGPRRSGVITFSEWYLEFGELPPGVTAAQLPGGKLPER